MISSDETDEEVSVQWPPQPRRPLRPAMTSHGPSNEYFLRRSGRHTFESDTRSSHAGDEQTEEVYSDSDYEDAALGLHSSRESITEDESADAVSGRCHYIPESSRIGQHEDRKGFRRVNKSVGYNDPTSSVKPSKRECYENRSAFDHRQHEVNAQHSNSPLTFLVILLAVIGITYCAVFNYSSEVADDDDIGNLPGMFSNRRDNYYELILRERIRTVKDRYPSQKEDLWYQFLAGIKKVTRDEPTQPTTFLLLHTIDAKDTLRCLTEEIARTAANFLNASFPVVVDGEELRKTHNVNLKASREAEDNGWLIEKYRPLVERSRAMVVYDLEKVPGTVAQAFHFFCDEVSPLVDKAVYLFTLTVPKYNTGRAVKVAEERLNTLWGSDLGDDIRAPLLTRITGAAVYVLPEKELPKFCS